MAERRLHGLERVLGVNALSSTARAVAAASVEIVVAVGAATVCVAALQSTASAAGLGVLYLLAVLAIAIRRGELPALVTAVLGILILNYLWTSRRSRRGPSLRRLTGVTCTTSSPRPWLTFARSTRSSSRCPRICP
jgi:Domain of unknown function (DUF4118)